MTITSQFEFIVMSLNFGVIFSQKRMIKNKDICPKLAVLNLFRQKNPIFFI